MSVYPWQALQWQALIQQRQQGKLPHAILCKGPQGLGKVDFAMQLAQVLLCTQSLESPCGRCRGCELWAAGHHPDFHLVTPEEKSKAIKVDQIRDLIVKLSQTAHSDGYQVAIIHPAEAMNRASHNALLKTLEEPIGSVVIVLCANQLASIPATILSRTQIINFHHPQPHLALPWLQQKLNKNAEQCALLLQWAEGAPLRVLELNDYSEIRDVVLRFLCQLLANQVLPTQAATELLKQDLNKILSMIFALGLDLLRLGFNYPLSALQNPDRAEPLRKINNKINLVLLAQWLPQLLQSQYRAQAHAGINVQLLLEEILLNWQALFTTESRHAG